MSNWLSKVNYAISSAQMLCLIVFVFAAEFWKERLHIGLSYAEAVADEFRENSSIHCRVKATWKARCGFLAVLGKRKQNKCHTLKIWPGGGLTCAMVCYSIKHSVRDSSEWVIRHTNHLGSQVSFLFPPPAALLPVLTTPAPTLPFIVLRHAAEPRQCGNHKNSSLLCCISPSG